MYRDDVSQCVVEFEVDGVEGLKRLGRSGEKDSWSQNGYQVYCVNPESIHSKMCSHPLKYVCYDQRPRGLQD